MEDQIIAAEAPVPVVLTTFSSGERSVYPLTPCCHASAKGWMDDDGTGGVVCRKCFEWVDDLFGICWEPDSGEGWKWYFELLMIAGESTVKAGEITEHVHDKVLAATREVMT